MRNACVCGLCLILAAAGLGLTPGPARAAGGALAFELTWSGTSDFDLAAQEPSGTWLTFNEPESEGGGVLNTDAGNNFCEESGDAPRESATWAEPVEGEYWVNVQLYSVCGAAEIQPFTLIVTVGGQPVERVQGVAVVGEDNTRIFNFVYSAVEWPPVAAGETAAAPQEGIAGLDGLFGEQGPAGDEPPVAAAPANAPNPPALPLPGQNADDDAAPVENPAAPGPVDMAGGATTIEVPRGPLRAQLLWAAVPNFDIDLMAKELGAMIVANEPPSASGGTLANGYGNTFCRGDTVPGQDLYGEEIVWPEGPLGQSVDISVALIGMCGPAGFVLVPGEKAQFTIALYDGAGQALYGPVQTETDENGLWTLKIVFEE